MQGLSNQELETHYQDLFAMYATPGWRRLVEQFRQMQEETNNVRRIESADALHFRRGELSIIDLVLFHQEQHETVYAHLLADEQGGDPEAATGGNAKVSE